MRRCGGLGMPGHFSISVEVNSSTSLFISAPTPPQKVSLKNKFSQRQMMTCQHPSLRAPAMFEKQFLIALYPPGTDLVPLCQTSREFMSPALGTLSSLCPAKVASSTQGGTAGIIMLQVAESDSCFSGWFPPPQPHSVIWTSTISHP